MASYVLFKFPEIGSGLFLTGLCPDGYICCQLCLACLYHGIYICLHFFFTGLHLFYFAQQELHHLMYIHIAAF
jgi:hypothetical protein